MAQNDLFDERSDLGWASMACFESSVTTYTSYSWYTGYTTYSYTGSSIMQTQR